MITAKELKKVLRYSPGNGQWYWRVPLGTVTDGARAGCISNGYWLIRIHKHTYRGARLAVLYMTGKWPVQKVDHRNRVTYDDRWCNLRTATNSQNAANCKRNTRNQSGYKGVRWMSRNKKWQARIRANGKLQSLGLHISAELAQAAYIKAAKKHFGEFANAG